MGSVVTIRPASGAGRADERKGSDGRPLIGGQAPPRSARHILYLIVAFYTQLRQVHYSCSMLFMYLVIPILLSGERALPYEATAMLTTNIQLTCHKRPQKTCPTYSGELTPPLLSLPFFFFLFLFGNETFQRVAGTDGRKIFLRFSLGVINRRTCLPCAPPQLGLRWSTIRLALSSP